MNSLIPKLKLALNLLIIVLFVYGIIAARQFLYPLALSTLFAYLLYPMVNFLEKKNFPRILAILASIILALSIIAFAFFMFYQQLSSLFSDYESLKQSANNNIELLQANLHAFFGLKDNSIEAFLKTWVNNFFDSSNGKITKAFTSTTGTILKFVLLPIYVFLMLFYRTKFAYFILKIVKKESKIIAINILRDISSVAARYMGGVSIVVLILCIINSTGLLIIGVEYAILLGIISAFFNFIPYFGTILGGSIPLIFVLLTSQTPAQHALQVFILFVIVQFTENNILTPNIVGGNVKINPFFIIVGLVVGGIVWGIPGMLVVVPFLAIARIIFKHIERLKPYAYLLGPRGTKKHSITLTKIKNTFYFRDKAKTDDA